MKATPDNGERLEIDHPLPLEPSAVGSSLGLGVIEYPGQHFDHAKIWN